MDKKIADELLAQTRKNYDSFAASFSQTRDYIPGNIAMFLKGFARRGDKVLDIGCGNGRLFPFFESKKTNYCGVITGAQAEQIESDIKTSSGKTEEEMIIANCNGDSLLPKA